MRLKDNIMNMTDLMWHMKAKGRSDDYLELWTIKEYLIEQIGKLHQEKREAEKHGDSVKMPGHLINIITIELDRRIKMLDYLLKDILFKLKEDDKKTGKIF